MKAFIYQFRLQWVLDLRNRGVLLTYYIIPLVFFAFMGGIFTTINPLAKETLIPSMIVFGVTMGAVLGTPTQIVGLYGSEIKKSYLAGEVPLWTGVTIFCLSAFVHLFLMSMIILLVAPFIFDATVPTDLPSFVITLMLFILATLGVGSALGLFVKSSTRLTMICQVVFLPSVMLTGIMFPVTMLPEALAQIGKILPATWGFYNLCLTSLDFQSLLPLFVIIGVTSLIIIVQLKRTKIN
ncbi:ABC transporter permease [Acetobacterium woodii]|uniref:Drug resistance ABC-2 type transporter permease protein n=1 Tax=Acetobacterium woodii (strain ATCC 29683 / DSM 1030 / JCM 2381 / KCTC 1655 / WB1) TaxID=931626 RepID=H6LBS4_ACEWD|nr:ABC transporter permease [Acetobacterium woodii]AFA47667.1 drug resistance ABC-2 type transporter permease protein [Acetobacterium woodii DSM 1030]